MIVSASKTQDYSRRLHVFAVPSQDAEHTYESLVQAFCYFGGGVKTVPVDNQKAAVLKNHNGNVWHRAVRPYPSTGSRGALMSVPDH